MDYLNQLEIAGRVRYKIWLDIEAVILDEAGDAKDFVQDLNLPEDYAAYTNLKYNIL